MTNTQSPAPGVAAEAREPIKLEDADRIELLDLVGDATIDANVPPQFAIVHLTLLCDFAEALLKRAAAKTAPPLPAQVQEAEDSGRISIRTDEYDRLGCCRRVLEIIAVGDSDDPAKDAKDELVAHGFWENREVLISRTTAPGMARGVDSDVSSTQKGGSNAEGSTLRTDALTAGRDTVTNAQDRVNLDAFTDLALIRESDILRSIAGDLEIMLTSATQHVSEECVTGYTIKTGALHRIVGTLVGNGFRVSIPLAPHPSPAPQAAGVERKLIPYIGHDAGKPELWMGYMDEQGCYMPVAGPDPVPKSWLAAITASGRDAS